MSALGDFFLIFAAGAAALGGLGFALAPTAYARLHWVSFVSSLAVPPAALAVVTHDPGPAMIAKVILILAASLAGGAVLTHATGRAIFLRGAAGR